MVSAKAVYHREEVCMPHPKHHVKVENGEPHWVVTYGDRELHCDFTDAELRETEREIMEEE